MDKTLAQLIEPLSESQRNFLVLRVLGQTAASSLRFLRLHQNSVYNWRATRKGFRETEKYVIRHAEGYQKQAAVLFLARAKKRAILLLGSFFSMSTQDLIDLLAAERRLVFDLMELVIKQRAFDDEGILLPSKGEEGETDTSL